MTPCARGCCWTPMAGVCARKRDCDCHWGDWLLPSPDKRGSAVNYRNPTQDRAIGNVMREQQRRGKSR